MVLLYSNVRSDAKMWQLYKTVYGYQSTMQNTKQNWETRYRKIHITPKFW